MRPRAVVVCWVTHIISLCRGQMFDMNLIELPEDPDSGMTYYDRAPKMRYMSDYQSNVNRNNNGATSYNNKDEDDDLSDLDQTLTKLKRWEDFEKLAEDIEQRNRLKKNVNMEQDARDLSKWLRDLKEGHVQKEAMRSDILAHPFVNRQKNYGKPSPGMSMYWPEDAIEKKGPVFPDQETDGKKAEAKIPVADVMNMAKQRMREALAKRGSNPPPQNQQLPLKPRRRMSDDVDPADDGIGPHALPQKEPRRPQEGLSRSKGDTEPIPPQEDYSLIGVGPADDGIGPHAPDQKGSSVPRPQEGALSPERAAGPLPFSDREDYSRLEVDPADDGIGPHALRQKRSPIPRPQEDGEPMPFPDQGDYSQMGGDGPLPRGDFSQMGGNRPSTPQHGGFPKMGSKGRMTELYKAAFPQKPLSALREGAGLLPRDGGDHMSAPQKSRLSGMATIPQAHYPQIGVNGVIDVFQAGGKTVYETLQERNAPYRGHFQPGAVPPMGGGGQMPFPQQGALPQSGGGGQMPLPQQGAFPQSGGGGPMPFPQQGPFPQSGGGGQLPSPQQAPFPQSDVGGPMPFPQQGAFPQSDGEGPMSFPQQGAFPQSDGEGSMPFPQQGAFPQSGGGGPMPFPQQGAFPQSGGEGPMPFPQKGAFPQSGGGGPMPFPQQGAFPQSGGGGQMPFPQQGAFPQSGGGGQMPFPQQRPPLGFEENMPSPFPENNEPLFPNAEEYQPGAGTIAPLNYANYDAEEFNAPRPRPNKGAMQKTGGGAPMPFPPKGSLPQMGGNGPKPFPRPGAKPTNGGNGQRGAMPQKGATGPMSDHQQEPHNDMDYFYSYDAKNSLPPGMFLPQATPEPFKMLPDKDDFNTPIKWVPMSSAKVEDGIAKVTDMDTGRNFNVVVNGSIFVPIIDDSIVPTEVPPTTVVTLVPRTTTENVAMTALLQFVTPEELTRNDWLGFDAALNNKQKADKECDGGGCGARCHTRSCQSRCQGDTCSAGCIGIDCQSSCDGPGCLSMCIGDKCKATCSGQACDARCKGSDCKTDCKSFSCTHTSNGSVKRGGGSWDQHYPEQGGQDPDGPQGPPGKGQGQLRMGPMYEEEYSMKSESD